jgi:hypothetical protein
MFLLRSSDVSGAVPNNAKTGGVASIGAGRSFIESCCARTFVYAVSLANVRVPIVTDFRKLVAVDIAFLGSRLILAEFSIVKVAAILSVVESCRRLEISVRDYFSTILRGLADLPIRCLPDLTPAVWVGRHS